MGVGEWESGRYAPAGSQERARICMAIGRTDTLGMVYVTTESRDGVWESRDTTTMLLEGQGGAAETAGRLTRANSFESPP